MPDRISRFRTIRLSIHPAADDEGAAVWALSVSETTRGVPVGSMLDRGVIRGLGHSPSVPEIWDAIWEVADARASLLTDAGWAEPPEPPSGGYGGDTPLPGLDA